MEICGVQNHNIDCEEEEENEQEEDIHQELVIEEEEMNSTISCNAESVGILLPKEHIHPM